MAHYARVLHARPTGSLEPIADEVIQRAVVAALDYKFGDEEDGYEHFVLVVGPGATIGRECLKQDRPVDRRRVLGFKNRDVDVALWGFPTLRAANAALHLFDQSLVYLIEGKRDEEEVDEAA